MEENININLGSWSSVFAVPCDIVDKYIKLAGAAQLKVLLWILRNSGRSFTPEEIGKELSMHPADVKDSIEFWVTAGLIAKDKEALSPAKAENTSDTPVEVSEVKEEIIEKKETPKRALTRPQKPDSIFVAQRINSDSDIASLMQEAEVILGRPLSHNDSSTLLLMHDHDGLPVDVILMALQYAVSQGKGMRYIEQLGAGWSSDGIDTMEKAEERIKSLIESKQAWNKASKIFGIRNVGSPTKAQVEYSNRWINKWHYTDEMLREAYELCINQKGEFNLRYLDGIIKKWHNSGILTMDELKAAQNKKAAKTAKSGRKNDTSYDIEAYENFSIFDKEE